MLTLTTLIFIILKMFLLNVNDLFFLQFFYPSCISGKVQVKSLDIQVGDLIIVEKVCCPFFFLISLSFVVQGISINFLLCDPSHEILSFFQWDIVSVSPLTVCGSL